MRAFVILLVLVLSAASAYAGHDARRSAPVSRTPISTRPVPVKKPTKPGRPDHRRHAMPYFRYHYPHWSTRGGK